MTSTRPRPRLRALLAAAGLAAGIILAPPAAGIIEAADPTPDLGAVMGSSGSGNGAVGQNWVGDVADGVTIDLYDPGDALVDTQTGFPDPGADAYWFGVDFSTWFEPGWRIVATGNDSGYVIDMVVAELLVTDVDRLDRIVSGTTRSADAVWAEVYVPDTSGNFPRTVVRDAIKTGPTDGVYQWSVDFTTAPTPGTGENGEAITTPVDVLVGQAGTGSTAGTLAGFSTPRIEVRGPEQYGVQVWPVGEDVKIRFESGVETFETVVLRPWIDESGQGGVGVNIDEIQGLTEAWGTGEDWNISVLSAPAGDVLAQVTLPLLTLDSVNTNTNEIRGQADVPLFINVDTSNYDAIEGLQFVVETSPWSVPLPGDDPLPVADRSVTVIWNSMAGFGHDLFLAYPWPGFTYSQTYDDATGSVSHSLDGSGGAPGEIRAPWPHPSTLTVTVDDPNPDPSTSYDQTFTTDTFVIDEILTGFRVDLADASIPIPPDAVDAGWTFTVSTDIDAVPMSKTLAIQNVSVDTVDREVGTASGTCTPGVQGWIVQVGRGDPSTGWAEELDPECIEGIQDGTWSVDFDPNEPAPVSYVWASYTEPDADVTTAAWQFEVDDPGEGPPYEVYVGGLENPHGLAFDDVGNLYVTDEGQSGVVWKIEPEGAPEVFATGFVGVSGIAFAPDGTLYVSDDTDRVFSVDGFGNATEFIGPSAGLANPNRIAFDAAGNLYVVNATNGNVDKFDAAGVPIAQPLAGPFSTPQGIVVDDPAGFIYVSDNTGSIFEIDMNTGGTTERVNVGGGNDGGLVRDGDGNFYIPWLGDNGEVLRVDPEWNTHGCLGGISYPLGLAIGPPDGEIYIASYDTGQILRAYGCDGPGGTPYELYADGMNGPYHHAWDDAGNLFVADENESVVWRIDASTQERTQFGPSITGASGVAFDSTWTLHVSDDDGRVVALDGGGNLTEVLTGLENPNAIAFDASDNLYIAEAGSRLLERPVGGGVGVLVDSLNTPQGVLVDPDSGYVWVGASDGTIRGVDPVTGDVFEVIDTGYPNDGGLARDGDGNFYAPGTEFDGVIRIDGDRNIEECLRGIPYPRGMSIGPDGWIYVSAFATGEVARAGGCDGQGGQPHFNVHVNDDSVEGFNWPEGALIHLEILEDLDAEPPVVLFQMDVPVGENDVGSDGNVGFRFAGEFDVQPGHRVIMSDGETTERHIVQPVEVTEIDVENGVVHGIAEPGDQIWAFARNDSDEAIRLVTADPETAEQPGAWTANFSIAGTGEHDAGTIELEPGVGGGAIESDPVNGNDTEFIWRVPNPVFFVYPFFGSISGQDWTEGAEALITIDDPDTSESPDIELSATVERFEPWEPPGFDVGFDGEEYAIEPGHIVTVTDGTTTKTHVVTELQVSGADAADNAVSGTAEAETEIVVWVHADPGAERVVAANAGGEWTADFSPEGPEDEWQGLEFGMYLQALQPDGDGDATVADWQIVPPRITADQFDDIIRIDWPESGVTFDVRVSHLSDGSTWTGTGLTTELIGEFPWETGLFIDLYSDHDVVTDTLIELLEPGTETVIRELLVSPLTVTQLDPNDDGTVHGRATPGSWLQLDMGNSTGWAWRAVEVDATGDWIAYPGRDPGETGEEGDGIVEDVGYRFEVGFNVEEPDDDGDATVVRWENYRMGAVSVLTGRDIVVGERWTGLWPATLTVEDANGNIVYNEAGIELDRGPSPLAIDGEPLFWDSPEWENHFSKQVPVAMLPGYTVTITDGLYTESTVVSSVFVTEVDLANDVIRGTTDPDQLVLVFTEQLEPEDPFFSSAHFTCSDSAGDWFVNFGEPLAGPIELSCLPEGAQQPLGEGEEIPPFDLDHTTVLRGFASTTDSDNPFGNEPDDDDGTIATWWTHLAALEAVPSVAEVDVDEVTFTATIAGTDSFVLARSALEATVDWGDDSTPSAITLVGDGDIGISESHTYATPGVYEVVLTVTFEDGHVEIEAYRYVVVFDPAGGFVTGGGWINSPAGAYLPDPTVTGQLHFGFNAKYQKHATVPTVPTGQTNIQFQAADLHFHSDAYDWLVVIGDTALYRGTGSVNGEDGAYTFLVRVTDDGEDDTFDFYLWDGEDIVYHVCDAPLGKGSIKVHG